MNGKDTFFSVKRSLNLRGRLVEIDRPLVMGVLNLTPDSFYPGSRVPGNSAALDLAVRMVEEGADILDIGALSSRPGAEMIEPGEEAARLFPVLELLRKKFPDLPLSVDTFRSEIAREAVRQFEADMINDISGGALDPAMFEMLASEKAAYIMMHMKGTPADMQQRAEYTDLMGEIKSTFAERLYRLRQLGVCDIIIDPGFGFAKTVGHNYLLLSRLEELQIFELPILVGLSRKSMIYKLLGTGPEEALNGTTVLNTIALLKGASILRVHDVKPAVEAVKIVSGMRVKAEE